MSILLAKYFNKLREVDGQTGSNSPKITILKNRLSGLFHKE
jgi:hypothetical protein